MKKRRLEIVTKEVKPEIQSDSFIGVGPCFDNINWSNYWTISPNGFPGALKDGKDLKNLISGIASHEGNESVALDTMAGFGAGYYGSGGNIGVGFAVGSFSLNRSCYKCHP